MAAYRIANPIQRANALQGGAAPAAAAAAAPAEADGAAPPDVVNGGAAAAVRGARIATAEERRVRFLYHNRPRLRLTSAPKVLTCIVQDRDTWEQPLCYAPLLLPCMRNAFYAIPVQQVLRKSLQAETLNPLSPSVIYSLSLANEATGQPQLQPQQQQSSSVLQPLSSAESQALLPLQAQHTTPLYHVPLTLPRPGTTANVGAAPQQSPSFFQRFLNAQPSYIAESGVGDRGAQTDTLGSSLSQNCLHLLYRALCVRCAIASQAQAFQADARMRGAEPFKFGCCDFVGVESKSYAALLRWIVLLDCLTLGVPCGCCCYHGLGTALFGWHLRFVLRARYRIFSWTSIDLLIMCCVPGLAVDQQGAELLLNGMPEIPVGLAFMS
uniref:Uncharacterized protein n=1 Tax=Angomonas deanei TaxID=59799 RepID=C6K3R0_9TRYP|nr:conserved hypothetical protein [Angomonas deanei]